jgi:protein-S-isoprenylcysteine O-methyltransferase Ste14
MPNVPTERLVASGLYLRVRNPMYVGDLIVLAGEAMLFQSLAMAIYTIIIAIGFHLFILLDEERTLARRHPADYPLYRANVPRWLPRFTAWNSGQV